MIESRSRFFSFVLLLGGLITCSCQQSSSDNKEHPLDFSNPAVSLSYETEEVPQGEFISCGDQHLRLRIRPFGGDYLTNNEKRNDRQLAELVRKFVLNPTYRFTRRRNLLERISDKSYTSSLFSAMG
jgi:hypothetical protein